MAAAPEPVSAPTANEVRRICSIADPILRNLEITWCYYRLSLALTRLTGECTNWCTFATWASKQAGRTIRGEDWMDAVTQNTVTGSLVRHPIRFLWLLLLRSGLLNPNSFAGRVANAIHSPFDALQRASDAVARGNLKVFEEIGYQFAVYLDKGSVELRPGPPPEGQDYLKSAFARYTRQPTEQNPAFRSQLIFAANVEIGLHEQARLQPEIVESLEAPPATAGDLGRRMLQAVYPGAWNWSAFVQRPFAAMLRPAARRLFRYSRELTRRMITQSLMTLTLPVTTLALGRHLDRPPAAALASITDPELATLLAQVEPCRGALADCAATDWGDLDQRMHYIFHLFRAFHDSRDLLGPPFTAEQVDLLKQGRIPGGRL